MANVFFIADTHWQHRLMEQYRPWATIEEHDEALIKNWNDRVRPNDKIYHLGDFSMNKRAIRAIGPRLNGDKVLIKGNHDTGSLNDYREAGFRDVRAVWPVGRTGVLTHVPMHPMSVERWGLNIHGHLHTNTVKITDRWKNESDDPRYFCVSVEQIDYSPISLDEIRERVSAR